MCTFETIDPITYVSFKTDPYTSSTTEIVGDKLSSLSRGSVCKLGFIKIQFLGSAETFNLLFRLCRWRWAFHYVILYVEQAQCCISHHCTRHVRQLRKMILAARWFVLAGRSRCTFTIEVIEDYSSSWIQIPS